MFLTRHHNYQKNLFIRPVRLFRQFFFKGKKYRCNVCEKNYKRFLTYGFSKRANVMCPGCGSIESTRTLWFYLTNEVLGQKNKNKFLYFSPEQSVLKNIKKRDIQLDIYPLNYFGTQQSEPKKNLKGGIYDVIIFSHLIQYLKNDEEVFVELRRLLRPGGFILVQTVINHEMERTYEHIKNFEDRDRLKLYYEQGVESVYGANFYKYLVKAGFAVEEINYPDQLGSAAKAYYRLGNGEREVIFKCKKI